MQPAASTFSIRLSLNHRPDSLAPVPSRILRTNNPLKPLEFLIRYPDIHSIMLSIDLTTPSKPGGNGGRELMPGLLAGDDRLKSADAQRQSLPSKAPETRSHRHVAA